MTRENWKSIAVRFTKIIEGITEETVQSAANRWIYEHPNIRIIRKSPPEKGFSVSQGWFFTIHIEYEGLMQSTGG